MKRLLTRLLARYCADCGRFVWPWQPRCGQRHTTCAHRGIIASWLRNKDLTSGPYQPWACPFCHKIPTEARP